MRVLLADDHLQVRSALCLLLEQEPGFQVAGETAEAAGWRADDHCAVCPGSALLGAHGSKR